jgi:hypothetical protein
MLGRSNEGDEVAGQIETTYGTLDGIEEIK